jgi:uncharacterized protein DUF6459
MTATIPDLAPPRDRSEPAPLRWLPIPDTEPPPEPPLEPYAGRVHAAGPAQLTLALTTVTSAGPEPEVHRPFGSFEPRPTATAELPDPAAWARRMAQAVVEVLSGVRPAAQLVRWTTFEVYSGLQRRCAPAASRSAPSRRAVVRTVRVCLPADGVAEASAVVVARGRVQAVALRLEGLDGRWRMTALELG